MIFPITPIGGYIPPFLPLSNVTPFTYRDGETNAEMLRRMKDYINNTLVDFINTNVTGIGDSFQEEIDALLTQIDAAIVLQNQTVTDQLEAQNTSVTDQLAAQTVSVDSVLAAANTAVDNANDAIDEANASNASTAAALATALSGVNLSITTLTNYVNSQVALIVDNSIEISDPLVASMVEDTDSDTRLALDALYSVDSVGDADVAGFVNDSGSDTRVALDALYNAGLTSGEIEPIVDDLVNDTGSDLRASLDALYTPPVIANLNASVITAGTFPAARLQNLENMNGDLTIAKGGTGATTVAGARTNLGITSGSAAPSGGADGDIYLQVI